MSEKKPTPVIIEKETFTFDKRSHPINKVFTLEKKGSGELKQFLVLLPTSIFDIHIKVDDRSIHKDSYTNFATVSQFIEDIDAFQDGTNYVFSAVNMFFKRSFSVYFSVVSPITVTRIFIKWTIEKEG